MAKTPQAGIGRQRFDFTSATGTIEGFMASASDGGGGGGLDMAGVGDEQLVRVVDDQFTMLIESIAGINVAASFSLVDTQFQALIAALGGVVTNTNAGQTPTPVPGATSLVQLVDTQYNGILAALGNLGVINPPSPTPTPTGGGPNPPPNPPMPMREILLVELIDEQLQKILDIKVRSSSRKIPVVNPPKMKWYENQDIETRISKFANKYGFSSQRFKQARGIGNKVRGLGRAITGTQAGGTLGAIGGGLAKAAGPIGLAIAAADKMWKTIASVINAALDGIRSLGEVAKKAAGNDGIGIIISANRAIGGMLEKIPIVGKAMAAFQDIIPTILETFQSTLKAVADRGRELSKYSPELALATAQADVRKIFADIREAKANERKYADLILKQQQIEESFTKALQPLKEAVATILITIAPHIERMATQLGDMLKFFLGDDAASFSSQFKNMTDDQLNEAKRQHKDNADLLGKILDEMIRRRQEKLQGQEFLERLGNMAEFIPLENFADPVDNRNVPNFKFPMVR
jgi:hypothetical protein